MICEEAETEISDIAPAVPEGTSFVSGESEAMKRLENKRCVVYKDEELLFHTLVARLSFKGRGEKIIYLSPPFIYLV